MKYSTNVITALGVGPAFMARWVAGVVADWGSSGRRCLTGNSSSERVRHVVSVTILRVMAPVSRRVALGRLVITNASSARAYVARSVGGCALTRAGALDAALGAGPDQRMAANG